MSLDSGAYPIVNAVPVVSGYTTINGLSIHDTQPTCTAAAAITGSNVIGNFSWYDNLEGGVTGTLTDGQVLQGFYRRLNGGNIAASGTAFGIIPYGSPGAAVDVGGGLALRAFSFGGILPAPVSGVFYNVPNTYGYTTLEIHASYISANFAFASLWTPVDGFVIEIYNFAPYTMEFLHNDSTNILTGFSVIWCPGGTSLTLSAPSGTGSFSWARLRYSANYTAWLVTGHS
jgi:hypothetical protein